MLSQTLGLFYDRLKTIAIFNHSSIGNQLIIFKNFDKISQI